MANPKRKHSRSRRDKRRANWLRLKIPALGKCRHCGAPTIPHMACLHCGFYKQAKLVDRK